MPIINLKPDSYVEEELFYRKHVIEAVGKEEGEIYLKQIGATRTKYGGLPAMMEAQIKDLMKE